MGCASSKSSKTRCHHCQTPLSPKHLPRSYSVPVHHPSSRKGDSYHVVALTSSTLGSLHEDSDDDKVIVHNLKGEDVYKEVNDDKSREFLSEVLQAKNWSNMIDEKIPKFIPKTPSITPPGEPETINTWELMEGLDEYSPLRLPNHLDRSFTFHSISTVSPFDHLRFDEDDVDSPTIGPPKPKPQLNVAVSSVDQSKGNEDGFDSVANGEVRLSVQSNGNDAGSLLDHPNVNGSDFVVPAIGEIGGESMDESKENGVESSTDESEVTEDGCNSPIVGEAETILGENGMGTPKPLWLQMEDDETAENLNPIISDFDPEIVSQFRKALEELSPVSTANLKSPEREKVPFSRENGFLSQDFIEDKVEDVITPYKSPPYGEDKVVIYFTSLRGVRKTYEDCDLVRVILKGFGVRLDERDVSMHYGFREELRELSEEVGCGGGLPRVFIKGRYIGGADEIKQLNEEGKLEKMVQGCAVMEEGNVYNPCAFCGDVRFVPCESCSGSCKIYCEEEGDESEGEEGVGEFQRCPNCNENGIVRCPVCCY